MDSENVLDWIRGILLLNNPALQNLVVTGDAQMSPGEYIRKWSLLAFEKGFLWVFGETEPEAMCILRPINEELADKIRSDYYSTILDFDPEGDIAFIDFAYGRGFYPRFYQLVESTGRPRMAWVHRDRVHVHPVKSVPSFSLLSD